MDTHRRTRSERRTFSGKHDGKHEPWRTRSEPKRPVKRKTQKVPAEDGKCQFNGEDYPAWLGFAPHKPGSDFKNSFPAVEGDPWEKTMHMIQKEDDAVCDAWNAEIQNHLIFSGLFSAVVTAFAVETQRLLQEDAEVATVLLLAQLNHHFLPNSTLTEEIAAPFRDQIPNTQSFRINCLIFSSLIISLGTALVGIIVLQWIRSYRKPEGSYDRTGISLREGRHHAFQKWGVPTIIAYLPVGLGVSFIIFLAGLVDFLRTMNTNLAILIGAFVTCFCIFLTATTFLPAFHILLRKDPIPLCAYQSPQSMLCCRVLTKFKAAREWTELIAQLHKERSSDQSRALWLKKSIVAIFRRFNSTQSFRLAYHCFQSLPKNVSENLVLRWDIVKDVLNDSEELCKTAERIVRAIESSLSPIACTEFLSLLLLLWNRRLDPQYTAHRSELYFRCIQTFGNLNEGTIDESYRDVINIWWKRSDSVLSYADGSREWRSYLTTFLTALQANPSFEGEKRPLAFSLFWKLLGSRIYEGSDESFIVVHDCLRVLTTWFLRVQNLSVAEYQALEENQVLRHALRPMFDHNVFTHGPIVLKLLTQEPSVLTDFLDIFVDPNHDRLKVGWKDAIESAFADTWDDFLMDTELNVQYGVLKKKVTQRTHHQSESLQSLAESSTVFAFSRRHSLTQPMSPEDYYPEDHENDRLLHRLDEVDIQEEQYPDPVSATSSIRSSSRQHATTAPISTALPLTSPQHGEGQTFELGYILPASENPFDRQEYMSSSSGQDSRNPFK